MNVSTPSAHQENVQTDERVTVPLLSSDDPLTSRYDTLLLDLDGVVYVGASAVPHAAEALEEAVRAGTRLAYMTNNASRTSAAIAEHLSGLGMPATAADVVTSAQAAARLLAERLPEGSPVLVVGGAGLREPVAERGLKPVSSAEDDPAAVVQGYDPTVSWRELAEAAYAVGRGVPYIATNLDLTIPTARGIAPGNGTLVAAVRTATGVDPEVAGKPEPPLVRECLLRTGARRPLVIGDRLDTDIEAATRYGADSMLVFTGVTDVATLLAAPRRHRPSYLAADLRGLHTAHAAPSRDERQGFTCGGWRASVRDGALVLDGDGDRYDAVRALCAASWSAPTPPDRSAALDRLEAL